MSYCPKCGSKITEDMSFCPKCGAAVKVAQAPTQAPSEARPTVYRRDEKAEKREKQEKGEKGEKREKGEYGFIGPLIGGIILIFLGFWLYLSIVTNASSRYLWPVFFVLIGIIIIVGAIYGTMMAGRRHPKT